MNLHHTNGLTSYIDFQLFVELIIPVWRAERTRQYDFLITAPFVDRITTKVADLIRMKTPFAALAPVSLLNEIDRKPDGTIDGEVQKARAVMQVIIISSTGQAWLSNHPECRLPNKQHYVLLTTQAEDPEKFAFENKNLLTTQTEDHPNAINGQ
jgi:hypothetical protein